MIEVVEGLRSASSRLPTSEELAAALQRAVIPGDHFYEPDGDHYSVIATASFDWMITYDSALLESGVPAAVLDRGAPVIAVNVLMGDAAMAAHGARCNKSMRS